ncbi:MAG: signal peptidase I [Armatimonadota bacterium]
MEAWTERIASLSLPHIVLGLVCLTAVRLVLRTGRTAVVRFLGELVEAVTLAAALVFLVLRPFVVHSYHIPTGSMRPTLREGDHILVNKLAYRISPPRHGDAVVFRAPLEADRGQREFIKRVVGLPGDRIEVLPGHVQVGNVVFGHPEILAVLGKGPSHEGAEGNLGPELHLTGDGIWIDGILVTPAEFRTAVLAPPGTPVVIEPGLVLRNGEPILEDYVAEDPEYRVPEIKIPAGRCYVLGDNRNQSHDSHRWGLLDLQRVIGRADAVFWPPNRIHLLR